MGKSCRWSSEAVRWTTASLTAPSALPKERCFIMEGVRWGSRALGPWVLNLATTGFNGAVWHARGDGTVSDLAVKLSVVDNHERGRREFMATERLAALGLDVAPIPIVLIEDSDVSALVSRWCPGTVPSEPPPARSTFWTRLVEVYAVVHQVDAKGLPRSVNWTVDEILDAAAFHARRAGRQGFDRVVREVRRRTGGGSPPMMMAVVHGDTNLTNVLVHNDSLRLVDWEYGGAGDPCVDIADLCTSPTNITVCPHRRPSRYSENARRRATTPVLRRRADCAL
jgi:aminoglycoside phosphotransferase (APT) family kinase protein